MSYNAWLYVDANPINLTDPSGQKIVCDNGYLGPCKNTPSSYNFRGYSDIELSSYAQGQGTDGSGCGPYSIAMALNLIEGHPYLYKGGSIQDELERHLLLKIPGLGMPPEWGSTQEAFQYYFQGHVAYYKNAGINDLKRELLEDKLPVVVFANQTNNQIWDDCRKRQTNQLTVGHYMVAVGFDDKYIKFLDPAGGGSLHPYTYADWTSQWASSNLFIPADSMFVISPWITSFPGVI
jgi:hypothetical protein